MKYLIVYMCAVLLLAGCSVVSKEVRGVVNDGATLSMVRAAPEKYLGETVLWGGIIITSKNGKDSTIIEVLETPLTSSHNPAGEGRVSAGRFLVVSPGFLDTVIYSPEKGITVAGVLKGMRTRKIGEMDYHYAVITPVEIHLFEEPKRPDYPEVGPWGYSPFYDPYYPYYWPYRPRSPWYYPY